MAADVDLWIHALHVVQRQGRRISHTVLRQLARNTGAFAPQFMSRLGNEVDRVGGRQTAAKLFQGRTVVDLGALSTVMQTNGGWGGGDWTEGATRATAFGQMLRPGPAASSPHGEARRAIPMGRDLLVKGTGTRADLDLA